MSSFQLKAEKREKFGSLEAKRIKKSGNIPAVIMSKKGNIDITLNAKEFETEFKKGNIRAKVTEIEIDGRKINAITRNVDLEPVTDRVTHVELLNLDDAEQIKAWPQVKVINADKSPGIKKGGFLNIRLRKVEVICDSIAQIPESVFLDTSKLIVGDKVRRADVNPGEGVKFADNKDFLFASITGRGKMAEEETAAPADADATAAAAAGPAGAAAAAEEAAKKAEGDKK